MYKNLLRVQLPMTFSAEIGLPFVLDIDRMLKFHEVIDSRILHFTRWTLRNNGMTKVAVSCDHFAFLTFMTVGMTAEKMNST